MRYELRPLGAWVDPVTTNRRSTAAFRASWTDTLALLDHETEQLGARIVVIQVDVTEGEIRRDGMLRANAKVGHPGVVVSFESNHGPLRYATDAYEQSYSHQMPSWQANVRAIALGLQALRAVDRYGVSKRGEQYVGWKALPAGPGGEFATSTEAAAWIDKTAAAHGISGSDRAKLAKNLARRLHPDAGGDRADWERLVQARRLLSLGNHA
jgi:hypothetical protein